MHASLVTPFTGLAYVKVRKNGQNGKVIIYLLNAFKIATNDRPVRRTIKVQVNNFNAPKFKNYA